VSKRALVLIAILVLAALAPAQQKFDVFYVAVGSGDYATSQLPGIQGFHRIPGATKSAKAVANLLERGGSAFGVTLVSDEEHYVGRDDIVQALSRIFKEIRTTHPPHPLVVVYFAGHGVADGGSWDHFSLPGTFMYRGELLNTISQNSAAMANITLHAGTLVAWLRDANLRFLLLLDNCYEGEPWKFEAKPAVPQPDAPCPPDPVTSFCLELKKQLAPAIKVDEQAKEMAKGFNEMLANFRMANRFENTYPVLFSTTPGTAVRTVADPFNSGPGVTAVAPLARRALIILTPVLNQGDSLSLEAFIQKITSPDLDPLTQPGVTYSHTPSDAGLLIISKGSRKNASESRIGTGTTPVVCCDDSQMLANAPAPQ
jgi:hypothetical protein